VSGIRCSDVRAALEEYLHNELAAVDAAQIADHLAACDDCSEEYRVGLVLTAAVKRACTECAPDALREEIRARLRSIELAG
jgi:anti-sigma factor (TIGR02949 family)